MSTTLLYRNYVAPCNLFRVNSDFSYDSLENFPIQEMPVCSIVKRNQTSFIRCCLRIVYRRKRVDGSGIIFFKKIEYKPRLLTQGPCDIKSRCSGKTNNYRPTGQSCVRTMESERSATTGNLIWENGAKQLIEKNWTSATPKWDRLPISQIPYYLQNTYYWF